jgi:hypothetical protein
VLDCDVSPVNKMSPKTGFEVATSSSKTGGKTNMLSSVLGISTMGVPGGRARGRNQSGNSVVFNRNNNNNSSGRKFEVREREAIELNEVQTRNTIIPELITSAFTSGKMKQLALIFYDQLRVRS